jgi:hypothetical protein
MAGRHSAHEDTQAGVHATRKQLLPELVGTVALDVAIAKAAHATIAWTTPQRTADSLALLMDAMSAAARLSVRRPTEFLGLLAQSLSEWLPDAPPEALLDHDGPTSFCFDVASEAGPTPEAELVQERIADARRVFAQRPNGESEYRAFREFLITHGYAQHVDAIRALLPSKIPLADLFQEIVSDATLTVDGTAYFYPCPRCRWPLRRRENTLSCACAECRAAGERAFESKRSDSFLSGRRPFRFQCPRPRAFSFGAALGDTRCSQASRRWISRTAFANSRPCGWSCGPIWISMTYACGMARPSGSST